MAYPPLDQLGTRGASSLGQKAYYLVLAVCVLVIAAFSYMTWYFYSMSEEASLVMIVIALPILIAIILLAMIVMAGKETVGNEIDSFLGRV